MTTAQQEYSERLLALRRAEVASELEHQGYSVESEASVDNQKTDLVATKPGFKTVVYEFKLAGQLHQNSEQIRTLRRVASENGIEFKLVVVTPPKRVEVTVEGLPGALESAFSKHLDATGLGSLGSHVSVEDVSDLEISSLSVRGDETDVAGQGVIDVRLDPGDGQSRDGDATYDSFPVRFDVTLSPQTQGIMVIRKLEVDTSSFRH